MKIEKLHEKIEWSKQKLATPCRNRVEAVQQFVGRNYSDNGSAKKVPVNLLELMASKQSGTVEVEKTDGSTATVECKDGQCSFCTDCTAK